MDIFVLPSGPCLVVRAVPLALEGYFFLWGGVTPSLYTHGISEKLMLDTKLEPRPLNFPLKPEMVLRRSRDPVKAGGPLPVSDRRDKNAGRTCREPGAKAEGLEEQTQVKRFRMLRVSSGLALLDPTTLEGRSLAA